MGLKIVKSCLENEKHHIIECFERCFFFPSVKILKSLVYSILLVWVWRNQINPSGDLSFMQERLITNLFRSFYFPLLHTSFCFSVSFEIKLSSEKTRRWNCCLLWFLVSWLWVMPEDKQQVIILAWGLGGGGGGSYFQKFLSVLKLQEMQLNLLFFDN